MLNFLYLFLILFHLIHSSANLKVIIDSDFGIDDVYALAFASTHHNLDIMAITTVYGNTGVQQATINANLVLEKIFPNHTTVKVYPGAAPFIANYKLFQYFGTDGLSGTTLWLYKSEIDKIKEALVNQKSIHAAKKIVELVNKHPNEITIIALGPLTNLALAYKISENPEEFSRKIKCLYLMGGNEPDNFTNYTSYGHGFNYPEFNFHTDPVAAKIIINEFKCPIKVLTFDYCIRAFAFDTQRIIDLFNNYMEESERCKFLERIGILHKYSLPETMRNIFASCDLSVMMAVVSNQVEYKPLNEHTIKVHSQNENGIFQRIYDVIELIKNKEQNVKLAVSLDKKVAFEMFQKSLETLYKLDTENKTKTKAKIG